jgi:glycosyltransferase involved in cell wall biosynthesis
MPIDIVISVRSTPDFPTITDFENCLQTLAETTRDYRLIVVDDNSYDAHQYQVAALVRQHRTALLIRTHYQRWFTRAYNLGLRMVRSPQAVVLNTDTLLRPGWLEELQAVWQEAESQHGRVGLVGSVLSHEEPRRWVTTQHPGYVTAHAVLVSMQALYEVSASRGMPGWYFDETRADMIHIRSDIDLSWKMNELGWQTVMSFKSHVDHIGGRSWGHCLALIPSNLADVSD